MSRINKNQEWLQGCLELCLNFKCFGDLRIKGHFHLFVNTQLFFPVSTYSDGV